MFPNDMYILGELTCEQIRQLKAEYKIYSELQEYFGKNSKHKAYLEIDKRMTIILNILENK